MTDCIFCKIINKTAPAEILYEDEQVIIINNIRPLTPVHLLILPRKHLSSMNDLTAEDTLLAGHMLMAAKMMADRMGINQKGYRLAINTGSQAGQTVFHLHLHLLGGAALDDSLLTRDIA